ncbi:MAG: PIN domain-containing protein [Terriglobia bacterium]
MDTHVVVWLAFDPSRLSKKARTAIDNAREKGDGLAISDITLLELTTLASKGRIHLDISLESSCLRARPWTPSGLSQGSGGSNDRGYRAG